MTKFKDQWSFEERLKESSRIKSKYPDRIPVIVELDDSKSLVPFLKKQPNFGPIEKKKYLVPNSLTVGEFQFVIRKKLKIDSTQSIFLFVNNKIPPTSELMSNIYNKEKEDDGFLTFLVSGENTFGHC